ncbi:MAG: hypothetical protein ACTSVI_00575 [Promethearchaeota archaeon]
MNYKTFIGTSRMNSLILYPPDNARLKLVADFMRNALKKILKSRKVASITLDELNDTLPIMESDLIVIGTPSMKNDIYWPIQVKIDGIIHKVIHDNFSSKKITAFTVSNDVENASRCLDALLWTFNETNATVINGLVIPESMDSNDIQEIIKEFVKKIKKS